MVTVTSEVLPDLESPPDSRSGRVLARFAVGLIALALTTVGIVLALWVTLIPLLTGWQPVAITSGSMMPLIDIGDVLVAEPYVGQQLDPGMVIVFNATSWDGMVSHRIESINGDGTITTRGDANQTADSTPVELADIVGIGRVLVSAVGWPTLWAGSGDFGALALAALGSFAVIYAARWGLLARFNPWLAAPEPSTPLSLQAPKPTHGLVGIATFLGISLMVTAVASSLLATTTASPANGLAAATFAPPSNLQAAGTCTGSPITFRAATSTAGQASSFTISKPVGTAAGDTMLTQIVVADDKALTAPSGWTLVRRSAAPGPWSAIYVKTAGATEPATYTWGIQSTARYAAGLGTWTNVHTVTPINVHGGQTGTGTSVIAPSVNTTSANTMLVAFWSIRDNTGLTIPGTMTKRWETASTSGAPKLNVQTAVGTELFVGTGATGTRTAISAASEENGGQLIALRPAAAAGSSVNLTWAATPSAIATGYKLQRWLGPVLQTEQTLTPRTLTGTNDATVIGGQTYTYRLFSYSNTWTSTVISTTVTVPSC